jgi:hypothetical protein
MNISFDVENFKSRPASLIAVLSHLKACNCYVPSRSIEIERIACRTPSSALKFCRYVNVALNPESEKVFLKNPKLGIRYLRSSHRQEMQDEKVQKRFWRHITKKPELALEWSQYTGRRLSEQEEEVFVKDMRCMNVYAQKIIKGKFPESVHQMIVLRSFEQMTRYHKMSLEEYIKFVEKGNNAFV